MGNTILVSIPDTEVIASSEMDNRSAEFWIKHLNLMEHPDHKNGYFAVPFEDPLKVSSRNKDDRPASSIAYFLEKVAPPVTMKTIFFKCQSTEMLFHHAGGAMTVRIVDEGAVRVEDLRRVVHAAGGAHGLRERGGFLRVQLRDGSGISSG